MAVLQGITLYLQTFFSQLRVAMREDSKGWTICLCVLILTILRSGITYSFGEFVVELEATYHRPLVEQNWIGTLSFCISLSCAPVSVAFIRALKYRGYRWGGIIGTVILGTSCMASSFVGTMEWLFLTHSLMYGVGSSLVYMASSLVIGEYFDDNHKYHVLATSILLCGYPIGSLLFNPINAWLVTRFTWRIAFRFSSILILGLGIGCCWTFSSKDEPGHTQFQNEEEEVAPKTPESEKPPPPKIPRKCCTLEEVKERPEIVLWYFANMISYLGFFMPFINLAYYMELKDISPEKSSFALTLLSFAECVTYIIASFVGDWFKGKLIMTNVIASGALALICIFWPVVDINYGVILLISLCMGGFLGLTIVYTYACSGEVTGLPIDIAWSYTNLWSGMGILLGPFFSGAIYDWRQSYDDVFYVVGCLYLIDAALFASIVYLQRRREQYGGLHPDYNEIAGIVGHGTTTQTFKITGNRSLSKGSLGDLANGEAAPGDGGHMTGSAREGAPLSPDPYAHAGYNTYKGESTTHPLAPSFHASQNYNSLQ